MLKLTEDDPIDSSDVEPGTDFSRMDLSGADLSDAE
jgi:uncharacterized protein YjbI with pentapeptide repeats